MADRRISELNSIQADEHVIPQYSFWNRITEGERRIFTEAVTATHENILWANLLQRQPREESHAVTNQELATIAPISSLRKARATGVSVADVVDVVVGL